MDHSPSASTTASHLDGWGFRPVGGPTALRTLAELAAGAAPPLSPVAREQPEEWEWDYESPDPSNAVPLSGIHPTPEIRRFVDGTALRIPLGVGLDPVTGRAVPLVGAAIGAMAALIGTDRRLSVEREIVPGQHMRRVVAVPAWNRTASEVKHLGQCLEKRGILLLALGEEPPARGSTFTHVARTAWRRVLQEMKNLECVAASGEGFPVPLTIVDGPLRRHLGDPTIQQTRPLIGVIKRPQRLMLPFEIQERIQRLPVHTRSRAFRIPPSPRGGPSLVTWLVQLEADEGVPGWGRVRVEVEESSLSALAGNGITAEVLDGLSYELIRYRSHAREYARAHCSLEPIVQIERALHAQTRSRSAMQTDFVERFFS